MILLLLLLPQLFLLAVHGLDSRKEEPRVVVIAIDGLRWQEVFEGARRDSLMPFLWKMGEGKGCMMGNRNRMSRMEVENGIWKSYAGYSEMLCGVTDDEHIFDNRKQHNPHRSVLEMTAALPDYRNRVSAVASWDVMPYILNIRRSELSVDFRSKHRVSAQVRRDSVTLHRAQKTLGDKHPKLLFVEFCETDYYAHHGKSISMPPTGTTSISENCGNTARATSFIEATPPLSLPATQQGNEPGYSCQPWRGGPAGVVGRAWQEDRGKQPDLVGGFRQEHTASGRNGGRTHCLHQPSSAYSRQNSECSVHGRQAEKKA